MDLSPYFQVPPQMAPNTASSTSRSFEGKVFTNCGMIHASKKLSNIVGLEQGPEKIERPGAFHCQACLDFNLK